MTALGSSSRFVPVIEVIRLPEPPCRLVAKGHHLDPLHLRLARAGRWVPVQGIQSAGSNLTFCAGGVFHTHWSHDPDLVHALVDLAGREGAAARWAPDYHVLLCKEGDTEIAAYVSDLLPTPCGASASWEQCI